MTPLILSSLSPLLLAVASDGETPGKIGGIATLDIVIIIAYIIGVVGIGNSFRSRPPHELQKMLPVGSGGSRYPESKWGRGVVKIWGLPWRNDQVFHSLR